ncbi:MAG: efflux RND transporter periplasmic adaptor subunit [Planctomycetes bacterium]|nr:efflux RND transporter periplasmic adaptor subunit [Planctomycetota bacterium]
MSSEQSSVNAETIEQTKQQIRSLVSEISQLSKSDIGAEEYYAAFLQRVVSALAAVGGAIWLVEEGRRLQLAYQINLSQTLLDSSSDDASRHLRLLNQVINSGEGNLFPPLSGSVEEDAGGNPTRYLIVLSPLRNDGQVEGIIEIFQRPDSPPATQRGYLRFMEQMSELAGEWLKTQKLRQFSDKTSLWAQADQFSRQIHESLELRETAYAVANEGRRLIGCDRVSVAINRGRKCYVEAVSGQDTMENRSNIVAALSNLATKVVATGEPLWYEGSTEDLPPQIEDAIEHYVDESYAKSLTVLPLRRPVSVDAGHQASTGHVNRDTDNLGEVIGALIIEQIETELPRNIVAPRMDLVYEHSALALTNSMDHSNLFLMPLWRTLGKAAWVVRARTLPKTLTIAGLILLTFCILTFVKKDFYLKAKGALQPSVKQDVFVAVSGIVTKVHVKDQDPVEAGDPIVTLQNTDLEVQLQEVLGQIQTTHEQLLSAIDSKSSRGSTNLTEDEKVRLGGQIRELKARIESLERQRGLLLKKNELLKIRAPMSGQVMLSWDIEESMMNRTVEPGQVLMTIADPSGEWELELFMKETRSGKVDVARHDLKQDLEVKYVLATDPGVEREGTVAGVEDITQMHDEEGHTVRIRVGIDQSDITHPRPGTTVRGKVLCGRAAIGYTWFHEAFEWVQANILF